MAEPTSGHKVLVIHGPNLNMLGKREPEMYGHQTLDEINAGLKVKADSLGLQIETFQSNHEGDIVEKIQQAHGTFDGILINPAAYTHTSIAIRDAFLAVDIPFIEIHLSNTFAREEFRHNSYFSDIAVSCLFGFGAFGYDLALLAASEYVVDAEEE